MMKLLAIGHSLVVDANRQFWSELARQQQIEVDVVCPQRWRSNLQPRINFSPNPKTDGNLSNIYPLRVFYSGNGSLFFFSPLMLWRTLTRRKYDVIYLNQETWALSTLLVVVIKRFSRNRRTPLALCVAQNLKKQKLEFLHPYERQIAKCVSGFFYCSSGVEQVLRWKGISAPGYYFPLPYSDSSYRQIVTPPLKPFRLGYLGRLTEDKGLQVLLKALDELNRSEHRYRLIVGGGGPLEAELRKRSYVEYRGFIPHNRAQEFYDDIDCFVLPSQTRPHWMEQFGRVIVEAFAAGKPVIGSSSGSIPEVLGKLAWPWVFMESSADDLRGKICAMEAHLSTTQGQSELRRSIELNREQFSQTAVAAQFQRDLCELIQNR